ncbi:glycosyltransferase family 4 protein [Cellulomonas composti]|uniref:Uncharacterized protein n=1 Tax=Cellulomonas composti TaxID=266130 RepID=A0A511JB10_9CELL|nr:glycosyltransferase family 4 protein [Cellulomonas composti]GEL95167.1 hypothetical protein CCO02nite_18250 [Cellulomonas composti]
MPDAPQEGAPYVVVTPWYPTTQRPHHGVFVREWTRAIGRPALVLHLDAVDPDEFDGPDEPTAPTEEDRPEGRLVRIPVPVAPSTSRALTAQAFAAALRGYLAAHRGLVTAASVVHAHVAMPAGYAAAVTVPPGARFVLTEHASYLPTILAREDARALYAVAAARASAVLMVGEAEARLLRTSVPAVADRVVAVGNPLDDTRFTPRPRPHGPLTAWVTVGNLVPGKGQEHVLSALAASPGSTLLVVGDGPARADLEEQARTLGVADRVELCGAVAPDQVPALLRERDVAVQLSDRETFGLAPLEALLAGLPVVATACGGPQTTLADAVARGVAALVPVRPSPAHVVAAITSLASDDTRGPGLDDGVDSDEGTDEADRADEAARAELVTRYGAAAFGARIRRVLDGDPLDAPDPGRPGVLTVALGPAASAALAARHDALLRAGGTVLHLTAGPAAALASDARLEAGALLETAWGAAAPPAPADPLGARWADRAASALPGKVGRAASAAGRRLRSRATSGAVAGERGLVESRCAGVLAGAETLAARLAPALADVTVVVPVADPADDPATRTASDALAAALVSALGARLGQPAELVRH